MKRNKFDVDYALDTVDLRFSNYTPSTDALEFFNLIRIFMGEDFEVPNPKFHYFIVDMLYGNVTKEQFPYPKDLQDVIMVTSSQVGILASRGTSKSTIVTLFYPIVAAIKGSLPATGPLSHILILSDSQQGGSRDQARLMGNAFEKSLFAKQWFESYRPTETEIELVRKGNEPIEKRHMLIKFKGASSGGIRSGSRNFVTGDRYGLILCDDVIKNEADARSETIMGNVVTALTSDAKNAMRAKNTQFVIINTPFHKKDPVYSMIESGGFTPLVIPICKEINPDLKKSEFIGAWEDMHDYYSVMNRYLDAVATHSTRQFNQELMLRVSNEEDRLVTDDMIQWYDRPMLMKMLDGYSLYITTDFTTTGNSLSDYSAISVWAVSNNFDYYLLDMSVKKLELEDQYNTLFRMVAVWGKNNRAIDVGVEIDGQQGAHVFALKQKMLMTNRYFNFARQVGSKGTSIGIRSGSSGNKHERFRYIVPQFQNGKIYFPNQLKDTADMKEALKQLKGVTVTGFTYNDDFCDTISQLALVDIIPGTGTDLNKALEANDMQMDMGFIWDGDPTEDKEEKLGGSTIF
jgi:phage terminase large subunit-like protein